MKKLAIIVTTPPTSHLTKSAIELAKNALEQEIEVIGIFFYQLGVLNAVKEQRVQSDEFNIAKAWTDLSKQVPLHLCSTAAEKYGVFTIQTNGHPDSKSILEGFQLSGLGELVLLTKNADRLVQL